MRAEDAGTPLHSSLLRSCLSKCSVHFVLTSGVGLAMASTPFTRPVAHAIINGAGLEARFIEDGLWYGRSVPTGTPDLLILQSGLDLPWWHDEKMAAWSLASRENLISAQIDSIVRNFQPDVFVVCDDAGPLEALIIWKMEQNGVPVINFSHGSRPLRHAARERLRSKKPIRGKSQLWNASRVRVQAKYLFAVPTYASKIFYRLVGVPRKRIRVTGWPYWSLAEHHDSPSAPTNCSETHRDVLIASTGSGLYSPNSLQDVNFWTEVGSVLQDKSGETRIAIRLKEGDRPAITQLRPTNVFCDCRSGLESLKMHKIVLTDSSTMAFEAALLRKSVFLVGSSWLFVKLLAFPRFHAHSVIGKPRRVGFLVGRFRRLVAKICLGAWEGALERCVSAVRTAVDASSAVRRTV